MRPLDDRGLTVLVLSLAIHLRQTISYFFTDRSLHRQKPFHTQKPFHRQKPFHKLNLCHKDIIEHVYICYDIPVSIFFCSSREAFAPKTTKDTQTEGQMARHSGRLSQIVTTRAAHHTKNSGYCPTRTSLNLLQSTHFKFFVPP